MSAAGARAARIGRTLGLGAVIAASLLTFPNAVPWMIAGWLAGHTVLVLRGKPGWVPLVLCAAIVAGKGTWPALEIVILAVATAAAVVVGLIRQMHPDRPLRWLARFCLCTLWIGWILTAGEWRRISDPPPPDHYSLDPFRPIVCLGDSLTSNDEIKENYPEKLQRLVPAPVINLGRYGQSISGAFADFPKLAELEPGIVVIELGGNDYVRGRSRSDAKADLERVIGAARNSGAHVILMEIPRGFVFDPWWGLERQLVRELAHEYEADVVLLPDSTIRSFVLHSPVAPPGAWIGGPYLSDDGLHPNDAGSQALAIAVADTIRKLTRHRPVP